MADIVVTDSGRADLCVLTGCKLDLEIGDGTGNDFELTVDVASGQRVDAGALVYIEGTEYGGVVDASESDSEDGVIRYTGRAWHGMLAGKVVCPPSGQSHRTVSGEANAVLLQMIGLFGLSAVMTASSEDSGLHVSSYRFERYCDGYSGIRKMLASCGARLSIAYDSVIGRAVLAAVPAVDYTTGPDSDIAGIRVRRVHRCVNHLISLGEGEGASRIVRHDYADADGRISQIQTFTGVDEICEVYDYSSADAEQLAERGPERLADLQDAGSLDASLDGVEWEYAIGDVVPGTDVDTGASVKVEVGSKVVVCTDDAITVEYKAGGAAASPALYVL